MNKSSIFCCGVSPLRAEGSRAGEQLKEKLLAIAMGSAQFERQPPAAATSAPPQLRELHLVTRIPQALFKPQGANYDNRPGLCYVARTDELFAAVAGNRTVNVVTPSAPNSRVRPVYTAPAPSEPCGVCLVRRTGTLLIASFADANR